MTMNLETDVRPPVLDVRISVIGSVDAGKSSTIAVLTKDVLDDGRGTARNLILKHPHEREGGRTSCASYTTQQVAPTHCITFVDLAGHEKYLKTTVAGLSDSIPQYAMLVVGSNMGILKMTKEHLMIATSLQFPLFVVFTKVDIAPLHILEGNLQSIQQHIQKYTQGKRTPVHIRTEAEFDAFMDNYHQTKMMFVPIFTISNTPNERGINPQYNQLHLLKRFVSGITPSISSDFEQRRTMKALFYIDENYKLEGIGHVLFGYVKKGQIAVGDQLFFGPIQGRYEEIAVKSIHNSTRETREYIQCGESGCLNIRAVNPKQFVIRRKLIRRGMIVTKHPARYSRFRARVFIYHHPSTITEGYEPIVHCGKVRQCAAIVKILQKRTRDTTPTSTPVVVSEVPTNLCLRTGDMAMIIMQFKFQPEYIEVGSSFIFRESEAKGIGKIEEVFEDTEAPAAADVPTSQ